MSVVIGRDNHYTNAITCLAVGAWRRKGVGGSYSLVRLLALSLRAAWKWLKHDMNRPRVIDDASRAQLRRSTSKFGRRREM